MTRTLHDYRRHLRNLVGEVANVARDSEQWVVSCRVCQSKRKKTVFRSDLVRGVVAQWEEHVASEAHLCRLEANPNDSD